MPDPFLLAVAGVATVVIVATAFAPRRRSTLHARADRIAAKVGLALDPEIEVLVIRRLVRERRFSLMLAAITWAAAFAVLTSIEGPDAPVSSVWFVNGAAVVGGAIGSAAAAAVDSRRRIAVDRPRVARSRSVGVVDYLPRSERIGSRIAMVLALAVVVVCVPAGALSPMTALLLGSLLIVLQLPCRIARRWILSQRQPAASTTELAWDDALRSLDLKAVEFASFTTSLYAVLGGLFALTALRSPAGRIADAGMIALLVGTAVLAIRHAGRAPHRDRYFLRRLWPETAAQAVVSEQAVDAQP